jgi:hypothetical protein
VAVGQHFTDRDQELAELVSDLRSYTELWDSLTTNQRRMLEALARDDRKGSTGPLGDRFRTRHRLGTYASAQRALDG